MTIANTSHAKKVASVRKRMGRPPLTKNPRGRIVVTAARLFAQNGYESSSLGDLAAAMGVSKAAIYHYFSTKQEIYDAIILKVLSGLVDVVSTEVAAQNTPAQKLRSFMVSHARYFETHHNEFVSMLIGFSGMTEVELKQEAVRLRDGYERMLRNIIDEGIRDGTFDQSNTVATTRCVLSMLAWMSRWFKPGAGTSAEDVVLEYYDLLMKGLEPRVTATMPPPT